MMSMRTVIQITLNLSDHELTGLTEILEKTPEELLPIMRSAQYLTHMNGAVTEIAQNIQKNLQNIRVNEPVLLHFNTSDPTETWFTLAMTRAKSNNAQDYETQLSHILAPIVAALSDPNRTEEMCAYLTPNNHQPLDLETLSISCLPPMQVQPVVDTDEKTADSASVQQIPPTPQAKATSDEKQPQNARQKTWAVVPMPDSDDSSWIRGCVPLAEENDDLSWIRGGGVPLTEAEDSDFLSGQIARLSLAPPDTQDRFITATPSTTHKGFFSPLAQSLSFQTSANKLKTRWHDELAQHPNLR